MEQHDVAALKGWRTVLKPNGHDVERSHSVTGNWPPDGHPLYADEALVGRVTDWLIEHGQTVFQMFLLDRDESTHSLMVLQRVNVPHAGRVLSLGSGIGGMEAYWKTARPDVQFTLVNASRAQLVRSRCPGERVQCDMRSPLAALPGRLGWYDLVVMGYSLHHCDDVPAMLRMARAMLRPGGTLLVLDVVDGSHRFHEVVNYCSLRSFELQHAGLVRLDGDCDWHRLPTEVIGERAAEVLDAGEVEPSMWIGAA